ncbi:MAG: hypothetical protein OEU76_07685, partial [Cyclobacteriaceae bacterium]|nr:hypothetical protein [Cyclobacteriaceae bacterium]
MIKAQLKKLEKLSRKLEPSENERKSVQDHVLKYAETFLNEIEKRKAFEYNSDKGIGLLDSPISENPIGIEKV